MPVPAKKTPRSRTRRRRSHHRLLVRSLSECPRCHQPMVPHRVCQNCGYYRGRDVLNLDAKLTKKEKKEKKKAQAKAEEERAKQAESDKG